MDERGTLTNETKASKNQVEVFIEDLDVLGDSISDLRDFVHRLQELGLHTNGWNFEKDVENEMEFSGVVDVTNLMKVMDYLYNDADLSDKISVSENTILISQ